MKHTYIILAFLMLCVVAGTNTAEAQNNYAPSASSVHAAENQRRLQLADSLYQERSARMQETRRELNEAERELKYAQNKYDAAKAAHRATTQSAREAKKSYQMEKKAIKARGKAEKQALRANQ